VRERACARHACLRCGQSSTAAGAAGAIAKCSMKCCGRWYHEACAVACPLTRWGAGRRSFRCAHHYCCHCGLSGDSVAMMQCNRCPVAYHVRRAACLASAECLCVGYGHLSAAPTEQKSVAQVQTVRGHHTEQEAHRLPSTLATSLFSDCV